jgi:hypothetical protein
MGLRSRLLDGDDFRVVAAIVLMKALAHHNVALNQHAADGRVGGGEADRFLGLLQGTLHPLLVNIRHP